jgi:hypothetical protein
MSQTTLRSLRILAALLAVTACSNDPNAGAGDGQTLRLRLTTPNRDDGALVFKVSGPGIDTAVAAVSSRLFTRRPDDTTMVGAIIGELAGGTIITLRVPDGQQPLEYNAQILEVADRGNQLRERLEGYTLTVAPWPRQSLGEDRLSPWPTSPTSRSTPRSPPIWRSQRSSLWPPG